jgi:hypothetical protein
LYQPAEKLFVGEQVQAGTGFKLLGEEYLFAERVQA